MNIKDYYEALNLKSQEIFSQSIIDFDNLGKTHHYSSFIIEFSNNIIDQEEKKLLKTVAIQLEASTFNLVSGMYRQAFSSLRLAFELSIGSIYFSMNKLEHKEWLNGKFDIKWSTLIDEEKGVLSKRFCNAFFPKMEDSINSYLTKSTITYRKLSEFVHGNNETWDKSGLKLEYNESLILDYFKHYQDITEVFFFLLFCRYITSFNPSQIESVSGFLLEEMGHVTQIREYLGGVK